MSIYDSLNEPQREAVYDTEGPLLLLAGAGSGKTRVLTHRIAYLIEEKHVNPWNILAITFTNKAASEMRERVDKIVGMGSESIWVSTFHSMCVRILRRYIDRLGYDTNFTIYDTDDQKTLMKDVCRFLQLDTKVYKIAEAYIEYEKEMRANNALDFDDLLVKTVQLFQTQPDVLEYYQNRFRYIMVDEYQDTNTVQFMLVSTLAGKYKNLCVVGDDDQSIYKFRGANIKNILNFEQVFTDAKVIKLEQNYRSTGNILNAANAVIAHNKGRKAKALWTENEQGEQVQFRQFDSAYEEAEFVVRDIRRNVNMKGEAYNDHAILYRTNAQSRMFEEKLVVSNIPYKIVGGINFYARREIKDLLAYLNTIENGKDDLAVRRIINVPKRGIGATTIGRIQDYAYEHEISFYEASKAAAGIQGVGRSAGKIERFVAVIEEMKAESDFLTISDLMDSIIETTGYVEELQAETDEEAEARLENIEELKNKMKAYEEECEEAGEKATLSGFLEQVALVADIDSLDETSDYVVLMTLHSAKGLEFPNVYLTGMEDGLFPSYMSINSEDPMEVEEERRLCYVGITRAKKRLALTCARRRMIHGTTQYNRVSRFVEEIPEDLLTEHVVFEKKKEVESVKSTAYQQAKQAFHSKPFAAAKPVQQFGKKQDGTLDYEVGDRVRHVKFGEGLVTQITSGGRDYEVTVNFDTAGVKKMFAMFARLQKI